MLPAEARLIGGAENAGVENVMTKVERGTVSDCRQKNSSDEDEKYEASSATATTSEYGQNRNLMKFLSGLDGWSGPGTSRLDFSGDPITHSLILSQFFTPVMDSNSLAVFARWQHYNAGGNKTDIQNGCAARLICLSVDDVSSFKSDCLFCFRDCANIGVSLY